MTASLLPPNATPLERALETGIRAPSVPVTLSTLWNPDTCPLALLPWLAWNLSVDTWEPGWSEATKRQAVRDAWYQHQIKGTRAAVEMALASFTDAYALAEWFEVVPPMPRGTFAVSLDIDGYDESDLPTPAVQAAVLRAIERAKRKSQHFTFTQTLTAELGLGLAIAARPAIYTRLDFTE